MSVEHEDAQVVVPTLERRVLAALLLIWWFSPVAWVWWVHRGLVKKMHQTRDKSAVFAAAFFGSMGVAFAWSLGVWCIEWHEKIDYVEGTKLYGLISLPYAAWIAFGPTGYDLWGRASARAQEIIEVREKKEAQAGDVSFAGEAPDDLKSKKE